MSARGSFEWRRKLSAAKQGTSPWNKGKHYKVKNRSPLQGINAGRTRVRNLLAANPDYVAREPVHTTKSWVMYRTMNLTLTEYKSLLAKQGGKCAIECCDATQSHPTRAAALHIEHWPGSRIVRGLTCSACNSRLAVLDDHQWVRAALAYIKCAQKEQREKAPNKG